jgi:hypothetical protein
MAKKKTKAAKKPAKRKIAKRQDENQLAARIVRDATR